MMKKASVDLNVIRNQMNKIFDKDMHLKRQHSLADAALGLLNSDSLQLHAFGEGLALGKGLNKKHTTKQIDRLLSNSKLDNWIIAEYWVPYVIGERKAIEVALDWTSFRHDSQQTLCLNLLTKHGRATPLLWKSVTHTQLVKDQRFGFGLAKTHIKSPERRDRLFFIVAIAYVLFTLLGAAGEQLGFDRKLKVNTVKTRTHSLIRQGMFYYDFFRHFSDQEKRLLLDRFHDLLQQHQFWDMILADI